MNGIAVVGQRQSVQGFRSVGFSVYEAETTDEAAKQLKKAIKDEYTVIYITEECAEAEAVSEIISKYKQLPAPAIICIPSAEGCRGYGMAAIKKSVEKAVGADILFKD